MSVAAEMKNSWNARARKDAFHYVETDAWTGDKEAFFRLGEERARLLIDPVLAQYDVTRGTAMEIGCGVGRFCAAMAGRFEHVVGLDVSDAMIEIARGLEPRSNIQFLATDGLTLPDHAADFIFSYEVFQHMPTREVVRQNILAAARAKAKSGMLMLHLKVRNSGMMQGVGRLIPSWVSSPIKAALGKDLLKNDSTYRGHPPLSESFIREAARTGGIEILELRPDPTHEPGTHVFLIAR